ncbi:MFS transporter [Acetobacter sp. AN02]|uniref:MFS transporter n=1 Tax=Acetobacter sp. AN02 TaxID=2894186 RepID=UPI0024342AF7|nr:MFS transporter [Acetobacter sp. AN02]MDG6094708.1 MFS transporter [Acetobacter sp. AN02]
MPSPAKAPGHQTSAGLTILSLAVMTFAIGTGEFSIMGLLPAVAHSLDVSIPMAGNVVSAYAIGVVIGAPVVTLATATMSRRNLMLMLTGWFAVMNILGALSPGLITLEIMRFLTGLTHASMFGTGALIAAGMAPEGQKGRAVGHVFSGLTIANVIGAPLASLIGEYGTWRWAYYFVGAISLFAIFLMARHLPADSPRRGASLLKRELSAFGRADVWFVLGTVVFGCGGMFSVYTYFAGGLTSVTHLPSWSVPYYQSLWGIGMVIGTYAGAWAIDKNVWKATVGSFIWNISVLALYAVTLPSAVPVTVAIFLLGGTIATGPAMQVRLMSVAGDAQTMAAAMNHAAFNMANAVGAWVGGAVLAAGLGYAWTGWAGVLISIIGLALFLFSSSGDRGAQSTVTRTDIPLH